ncbi:hypothetical protein SSYRP_v1c05960 [Spiroplasma syrphidicola EA-1]|uniref:Uncharacterized protein n=1 Tax=Spiroplasma syrphidicola EA-1 TaxID=1276229 RepID=R4ULU8_9MOLU|nr:hypothetical protein [Spiroplasma syrphidicola]AGM26186.1 hypothetical protein SSYRP_v1c05960 [Spiroplasma syrphidicola EA-1]
MQDERKDDLLIKYDQGKIAALIKQWQFPILALDFEAYHFKKDYKDYDHLKECNAKPFLVGVNVILNPTTLLKKPLDELMAYHYHLNWNINDKKLHSFKSFALFLTKLVRKHNIQTLLVLGKELEQELITVMTKRWPRWFRLKKLTIIDIYDLYANQTLFQLYLGEDSTPLKVKQIDQFLRFDELYQIMLRPANNDRQYWDNIWRRLDGFYSYDKKNLYQNLQQYQAEHLNEIIDKNYNDLLKMTSLLKTFISYGKKRQE